MEQNRLRLKKHRVVCTKKNRMHRLPTAVQKTVRLQPVLLLLRNNYIIMNETPANRKKVTESFRDSLATVDKEGRRKWIYAWKPKGKFYRIRTWLSYLYFIIFFGLPFVKINGRPLFMFNIPKGKVIVFGNIFWPQDFFIFGLAMVTFIFFIILFTAAFGRLFCGWACPQTNFMEMMFRRIEFAVLGNANQQ